MLQTSQKVLSIVWMARGRRANTFQTSPCRTFPFSLYQCSFFRILFFYLIQLANQFWRFLVIIQNLPTIWHKMMRIICVSLLSADDNVSTFKHNFSMSKISVRILSRAKSSVITRYKCCIQKKNVPKISFQITRSLLIFALKVRNEMTAIGTFWISHWNVVQHYSERSEHFTAMFCAYKAIIHACDCVEYSRTVFQQCMHSKMLKTHSNDGNIRINEVFIHTWWIGVQWIMLSVVQYSFDQMHASATDTGPKIYLFNCAHSNLTMMTSVMVRNVLTLS